MTGSSTRPPCRGATRSTGEGVHRQPVHLIPPFHQRLVEVPFRLNHPLWVKDPEFDLDYHVRRIGAPAPGGPAELGRVAGQIASTPLDRSRPLWEAWVVEGLADDNVALVAKVHHCGVDGSAGAQFMVHLFDLEPDAEGPDGPTPIETETVPSDGELMYHAAASRMRQRLNIVPLVGKTISSAATLIASRNSADRPSGALPLTAPATPFNAAISAKRNVAFSRVPLADMKAIKNAADATVNDVVLAICSGTLRRYLESKGELPDAPLLAVCPVAVTPDDKAGASANSVSAMFTSLASDISDPALRLAVISENTKGAKEDHNAIGADMLGAGRSSPPRTRCWHRGCTLDEPGRPPPPHPQPGHLERSRPAFLLRRRRAPGRSHGPGHGGRRAARHGDELSRLGDFGFMVATAPPRRVGPRRLRRARLHRALRGRRRPLTDERPSDRRCRKSVTGCHAKERP